MASKLWESVNSIEWLFPDTLSAQKHMFWISWFKSEFSAYKWHFKDCSFLNLINENHFLAMLEDSKSVAHVIDYAVPGSEQIQTFKMSFPPLFILILLDLYVWCYPISSLSRFPRVWLNPDWTKSAAHVIDYAVPGSERIYTVKMSFPPLFILILLDLYGWRYPIFSSSRFSSRVWLINKNLKSFIPVKIST